MTEAGGRQDVQLTVWDGVTADLVAETADGLASLVEGGLAGVWGSLVADLYGEGSVSGVLVESVGETYCRKGLGGRGQTCCWLCGWLVVEGVGVESG